MKFEISRVSEWHDKSPCEEAYSQEVEFFAYEGEPNPQTVWFIDINTLEELMAFCTKYGDLVLRPSTWRIADVPSLEIYDDYRE